MRQPLKPSMLNCRRINTTIRLTTFVGLIFISRLSKIATTFTTFTTFGGVPKSGKWVTIKRGQFLNQKSGQFLGFFQKMPKITLGTGTAAVKKCPLA